MALRIINGPGKWDLMQALFDQCYGDRPVTFVCVDKTSYQRDLKLNIRSVSIVRGRQERYRFEGISTLTNESFRGVIDVVTRQGNLQFNMLIARPVLCPKCDQLSDMDDDHSHFEGEPIFTCPTCKVTCDWDSDCNGPFMFVIGDPEGDGREYVGINYCSPHNHS